MRVAHLALVAAPAAALTLSEVQQQIAGFATTLQKSPEASPTLGCRIACQFLQTALPEALFLPNSTVYEQTELSYWSQQQSKVRPACRLLPATSSDVSLALLVSRATQCPFAVKSGGHSPATGSSNVQGGVTIDFARMKDIQISADKTEVAIEPGNVWYDVYTHLLPHNITVIGGRVSPIGTTGLTLGGGISFFSNQHGWACDNVNAYEIVLADGVLRTVTAEQYPDLYWALRGGGNNFGIVTRLHVAAYPQGDLWAGSQVFALTNENAKAHAEALAYFTERSTEDPKAQVIQAYAYAQVYNAYVLVSDLQYSVPQPFPAILSNFTAIQGSTTDTLRITDLPSLTLEFNESQPNGLRQSWDTIMVEIDAELIQEVVAIWKAGVEDVKNLKGSLPSLSLQPVSLDVLRLMGKNGGNALGLAGGDKPLLLMSLLFSWADEADDDLVYRTTKTTSERIVAAAKAKGRYNKYIYLNYGGQDQKVLQSYGDDNYARLKAISHKYDPQQVFQKLQPGGFKL